MSTREKIGQSRRIAVVRRRPSCLPDLRSCYSPLNMSANSEPATRKILEGLLADSPFQQLLGLRLDAFDLAAQTDMADDKAGDAGGTELVLESTLDSVDRAAHKKG